MARGSNPYAGQYAPSRMSMTKEQFMQGIKGLKLRSPNRKMSTQSYKSGLPKEHESES